MEVLEEATKETATKKNKNTAGKIMGATAVAGATTAVLSEGAVRVMRLRIDRLQKRVNKLCDRLKHERNPEKQLNLNAQITELKAKISEINTSLKSAKTTRNAAVGVAAVSGTTAANITARNTLNNIKNRKK